MNYNSLKDAIAQVIGPNDNQEITGQVLQNVLHTMINALANGYIFAGVATPATSPGNPDQNMFWIGGPGAYANFGEPVFEVPSYGIAIFTYNGSFTREVISLVVDNTPTEDSNNLITSGAVASAINILKKVKYINVNNLDSLFHANDLGIYLVYDNTELAVVGILSVFTNQVKTFIHQVLLSNYVNVEGGSSESSTTGEVHIIYRHCPINSSDNWTDWVSYKDDIISSIATLQFNLGTKSDKVELSSYMVANAALPSSGSYVWFGNSIESRLFTRDENGTTVHYQVFARSRGDSSANDFGITITDCALYRALSTYGPYTFVEHYQGNNIPDFILKAFGKSVATANSDGLLSKEDKETLDETAARIDVYNINYHQHTEFGYTLASALALVPEAKRHAGMIITYKKYGADSEWEAKQFTGNDWTGESSWTDFGGGGGDFVEVTSAEVAAMDDPS